MNRFFLITAALATCFYLGACERHSFEDTKVLFESHSAEHGDNHDKGHEGGDDGHEGEGDKAEKDGH